MKVNRYDYPSQFGHSIDALMEDLRCMILEGHYILSEEVQRFEKEFAHYLNVKHARGVNSGTDALMIALLALEAGNGGEVITQANTFYATVAAIRLAGAKPVLVDAEEDSFLMDLTQVPAAVTSNTRAIIPVHLFGKPVPMPDVMALARKHQVHVVEDAAQAHGARIGGRLAGTFGVAGCFSFHPSKNLAAAGDGGAIVTDDEAFAGRVEQYRALGQYEQNDHRVVGMNSKLDAIQARILSLKLPLLDKWNEERRTVAAWYQERLAGLPVAFQGASPDELHAWHVFQIRTERRDSLLGHLQRSGVDAVVRYPTPIHLQPAFADCGWRRGQFPVAERLADELLCLPIRPNMDVSEVDYVVDSVRSFFGPHG